MISLPPSCLSNVQHFAQRSSYSAITLLEVQLKQSVTRTQDVNSTANETKTVTLRARMAGKKMDEANFCKSL